MLWIELTEIVIAIYFYLKSLLITYYCTITMFNTIRMWLYFQSSNIWLGKQIENYMSTDRTDVFYTFEKVINFLKSNKFDKSRNN